MQSVLEFAPVAVFGVAYFTHGIYVATAALMICMALLLIVDLAWLKRIPTMHLLSAGLVFAFGAATLILHNQRFIQWKPTVRRFSCCRRRGVSRVAGSRKVNGPGVQALSMRNCGVSIRTKRAACPTSRQTSVK